MFLRHNNKPIAQCKVSRFVKLPFIDLKAKKPPECYENSENPLPLHTIVRSNNQTIFYTKNNIAYFYNSSLSVNEKIFPLYDYKRESYHLLILNNIETGYSYGIINCFRAPDGDLYITYSVRQENDSKSEIVVYNYTKNIIIYRKESPWWLNEMTFAIPIANSLLVSISQSGYSIWIKIIDLNREKEYDEDETDLESFVVSLRDYFVNIIDLIADRVSKEDIRRLNKVANNIASGYLHSEDIQYLGVPEITITAGIHDKDTVFYKGFEVQFDKINLKGSKTMIHNAFSISFMLEDDKVVIRLGTGKKGYVVINGNFINIPSNVYWLIGEYKLSNEYNLSKSKLYSVGKVSRNYMIIDGEIYYSNTGMPKTYIGYKHRSTIMYMFDDEDINIINVGYDRTTVVLGLTSSKISYKTAIHVTKKSHTEIEMININQLRDWIKQIQNDQKEEITEIMELPKEFIKTIKFDDMVKEVLYKTYRTKPSSSSYNYWYYVDEEKGHLYCLVIYTTASKDKNVILIRYYLERGNILPKIKGHIEIKSDELKKKPGLLDAKIASLIAYQDGNQLHLDRLLLRYVYNRSYNYLNEILMEMKYPLFILNDVKYNRANMLKYYKAEFKEIRDVHIGRKYNIVEWHVSGKMGRENSDVSVSFVISELTITKKISLMTNIPADD